MPVWLIVGDGYETNQYLRDRFGLINALDPSTYDGICISRNGISWVWLDEKSISTNVLAHELCHATFTIMKYLELNLEDEEAFCYILQNLVEQCESLLAIRMDLSKVPLMREDDQA